MTNSGLSLIHSFEFMTEDLVGKRLAACSHRISGKLLQGQPLEVAFKQEKECFSELQVSLLELGVKTGSLMNILSSLAYHQEKESQTQSQLIVALIYPAFVLAGCLLFVAVVPTLLFGSLFQLLESAEHTPGILTRGLAACGTFLQSPLGLFGLLGVLMLGGWMFRTWLGRPGSEYKIHRVLVRVPHLKSIMESTRSARLARALATVVTSGVNLDQGLRLACQGCGCPLLKNQVDQVVQRLHDGHDLTECLAATGLLPNLFIESIRTGEEAGRLGAMLEFLSRAYSLELEYQVARLEAVIKPLSLALMGGIVGLIAIGCISPLNQALSQL